MATRTPRVDEDPGVIARDLAALRSSGLEQLELLQLARFVQLDRAGSDDAPSALAQAQLLDIEVERAGAVSRLPPGNAGVQGRVVDDKGVALVGVEVSVVDPNGRALATATTAAGGYYSLQLAPADNTSISLVVRSAGVVLHQAPPVPLGKDQVLHSDLQVVRAARPSVPRPTAPR